MTRVALVFAGVPRWAPGADDDTTDPAGNAGPRVAGSVVTA